MPLAASNRTRAVFASADARRLLELNALADLDLIFLQAASARLRHDRRCVWQTELFDESGRATRVFVKLNWGRHRLLPRMNELKSGQFLQPLPVREWHGLSRLERLDLPVAERLAVFQEGLLNFRAAVFIRAVPPARSIADLLTSGEWWEFSDGERDQMLAEMAGTMRRIHAAGLGWRGTCVRHFFPEWLPDGSCRTWLIDCEGVYRGSGPRVVERDFRKLHKSLVLCGADDPTLARFEQMFRDSALPAATADTLFSRDPQGSALRDVGLQRTRSPAGRG